MNTQAVVALTLLAAAVAGTVVIVRRWPQWRAADRAALRARNEDEFRARQAADRARLLAEVAATQAWLKARRAAEQEHPSAVSAGAASSRRDGPEPRAAVASSSSRGQLIRDMFALRELDDLTYDPAVWEPKP